MSVRAGCGSSIKVGIKAALGQLYGTNAAAVSIMTRLSGRSSTISVAAGATDASPSAGPGPGR